ncbi:hypothetical protein BDD12DRAFT_808179 [Trichophaea hybrida]|nr:hypothetical protein BDD12DRAFT_808179 [Trichophaea hybrida]
MSIMAATSRAKRMKNRNVARRNLSKLPKPSKATNNGKDDKDGKDNGKDNCKDNGKDGGKDNGKDGGKDGGKDNGKDGGKDGGKNGGKEVEVEKELEKEPDEASEDGGWRPNVSRDFILKRLERDQTAAPKMQVSLAWAILRTPEADKDAWDATRTYAEQIWSESGITAATQGEDRFWTMCDDILAEPIWDEWRVVYAIGNRNHDGTLEAGGLLNEMNGEHYVWYAILSIIRNWSTKRKEREVRRHKRVLEDPETPRAATRARVYLPITPIVSPVRPADPDNELQAELFQLAEGTPAAPNVNTTVERIIQGGCEVFYIPQCYKIFFGRGIRIGVPRAWHKARGHLTAKDIRWGISLLPMPTMESLKNALRIMGVDADADLFGCLVFLVLGPLSWFNGLPSRVVTASGSPIPNSGPCTRGNGRRTEKTPPPSQAPPMKKRKIASILPSPDKSTDNCCSVSRFLEYEEEYRSEDEGGNEVDDDGDADDDGYEEYEEDLVRSLERRLEQARKRATNAKTKGSAKGIPYMPSQELTLALTKGASQGESQEASQDDPAPCNTNKNKREWNKRRFHPPEFDPAPVSNEWKASLEEVGIQLCSGEYLDANCPAYKVIRQAISNAVGNYWKMVQTNLMKEHYFGLGKLDEKYIFESDDQEKRENPYLTKVIARCMFDHFFSKDGPSRTADPYQDLLEKMNPTMICLTAFLIKWNLQAWRTGKCVPLAQLNSDSLPGFEFHKQLWDKNYESHEETAGAVDYMRHPICVIKARPELQSMDMSRASEAKVVVFGDRKASAAALRAKLEVEKKKLNEELEESGYSSPLTDLDD